MDINKIKFLALDLETTGFDPEKNEIIEVGLVLFDMGGELARYGSLVRYEGKLDSEIVNLTGINEVELKSAPLWSEVAVEITKLIDENVVVIGHNIGFDLSFLEKKGIVFPADRVVDSYDLATLFVFENESYSLEAMTRYINWEHDAHRALEDAVAVKSIFNYFLEKLKYVSDAALERLVAVVGRGEWRYGFLFLAELEDRRANGAKAQRSPIALKPIIVDQIKDKVNWFNVGNENPRAEFELWEANWWEVLSKAINDDYAIVVSKYVFRHLRKNYQGAVFIDAQSNYLCKQEFSDLLKKTSLQAAEISILVKILLKVDRSFWDGYLPDIRFDQTELKIVDGLRCGNPNKKHDKCYFTQKKPQPDEILIISADGLDYLKPEYNEKLVIWTEELLLEDGLTEMTKIDYRQSDWETFFESLQNCRSCQAVNKKKVSGWIGEMTVLWGLLGLLVRSKGVQDYGYTKFGLVPTLRNDFSLEQIKNMAGKLKKEISISFSQWSICSECELDWIKLRRLFDNLLNERDDILSATISINDDMVWEMRYGELYNYLTDLHKRYPKIVLAANSIFLQNKFYAKKIVFRDDWQVNCISTISNKVNSIEVSPGMADRISIQIDRFDFKRKNLVLYSSKPKVKDAMAELREVNHSRLDGGIRVAGRYFWENSKPGMMIFSWRETRLLSLLKDGFDVLMLESIPFDVPGDLVNGYRSLKFQDNNFTEYVIPRMLSRVKFFRSLVAHGKLIVADGRVNQKSYGVNVLDLLHEN